MSHGDRWGRAPWVVAVVAGLLLSTGCTTTDDSSTGSKGYITGDGAVTVLPADERPDAPDIAGDLLGGGSLDLAEYHGKTTVLNVWGSWCGPCRGEADDLVTASEELPDARFVGLNTRDDDSKAKAFVRNYGIPYPSLRDQDSRLLLAFSGMVNLVSLPITIVIDADGRVAAIVTGPITSGTLVDVIEQVEAS